MNYLDIILLIPILFGAWKGFKKGLIIELFTLLALLVGIYAAINFSDYMVNILETNLDYTGKYSPIVAFVLTFLVVGAMVYFLGKALEKVVSIVQLGMLNKVAGLLFGAVKLLMVSSMIVIVLEAIDQQNKFISKDLKDTSLLFEPLKNMSLSTIPGIKDSKLFKKESFIHQIIDGVGENLSSDK